jgi:CheY-like chemotaxis protein
MPTILLAEDQSITREPLRRLLTMEAYTVLTAASGTDALTLLIDGVRPDLLILDLMLPRMSGVELLETIHEQPVWRTIPIIVLTGCMARSQLDRARELNVHAVMQKAKFEVDELLFEIREALTPPRERVPM